jgi:hypothetical protein
VFSLQVSLEDTAATTLLGILITYAYPGHFKECTQNVVKQQTTAYINFTLTIFGAQTEGVTADREKCVTRSFRIYTL